MTNNEIKALMARMSIHWPNWRGPEDQETLALTVSEYAEYLGEFDEPTVRSALRQFVGDGRKFAPTVGELRSVALAATLRRQSAQRELEAPESTHRPSAGVQEAIDRALANWKASMEKHDHHQRQIIQDGAVVGTLTGAEACEVCKVHDHSDNRRAGHTNVLSYNLHGQPYWTEDEVLMWQLTCPLCGWPEMEMSAWTTAAIEWVKNQQSTTADES